MCPTVQTQSRDLPAFLASLQRDDDLGGELAYSTRLPAQEASFESLDPPLSSEIRKALGDLRLWSHQAAALSAVRRDENVLVTTPTASGKSLIYQLPPLEEALAGGDGKALFLFPLKALGQDQRTKFNTLAGAAGLDPSQASAAIYDGDTSREERAKIRRRFPRVVISNPDMLHLGVLGHWNGWTALLRDLKWVVLDELHTYRGVFGCHFHHVLSRFLRLCREEGSDPKLIASSATAANAREFAETLTGQPFTWVNESGAPREARHFLLFRPTASPYTTALNLLVHCLESGLKTIVFTKARRITELLYSWLRRQRPAMARRVASYRSGFLPEERRSIEGRLFDGSLDGVISTSALEMGIDVGGLDACILVGYPGSMMATWQRSGRVGRSGEESMTALVALPDALDHYLLDHPQELLERPCERLIVDPANEPISRRHVVCAASELPLEPTRDGVDGGYLDRYGDLVEELVADRHLRRARTGDGVFALERQPQRRVSLRGTGETFTIVDGTTGEMVGTVDGGRVLHEGHPGAVYLHGGRSYLVDVLDLKRRHVIIRPGQFDYFTTPMTEKETEVLEILEDRVEGPLHAHLGRVKVTERVVGFERKRVQSQEVISQHSLDLPSRSYETVALWWPAPRAIEETLRENEEHFLGALHAQEHAAISLFPLMALCDRGDIGGISYPSHPQIGCGAVFIYDGHPGGVGIAASGYATLTELFKQVLALVEGCDCDDGCPWCVQSPKCGNGNRPLDKEGAARVLRLLLGTEEPVALPAGVSGEPEPTLPIPIDPAASQVEGLANPRRLAADDPEVVGGPVPSPSAADSAKSTESTESADSTETGPRRRRRRVPRAASATETSPSANTVEAEGETQGTTSSPGSEARMTETPKRRPKGSKLTTLFDLETLRSANDVGGWGNAHKMGVALGVVCVLEEDRFEVFREPEVPALIELLKSSALVVGFNSQGFDYKVLSGYTGVDYGRVLPTLDLLVEVRRAVGHRLSLNALAAETLGAAKSADGLQSLEWVKQGRFDLIEEYCRQDVAILRDLYLHGRREGRVFFRNRTGRRQEILVDW